MRLRNEEQRAEERKANLDGGVATAIEDLSCLDASDGGHRQRLRSGNE